MDSYISQYNDLVEKKCKEELNIKKNKEMKNILAGNTKYNKEFNAFVIPQTLNGYEYLGGDGINEEVDDEIELSLASSVAPSLASSIMPSRAASPIALIGDVPPLTKKELFEARQTPLSSVFSQGLVSRRGAPPLLELPTEIKERIFFSQGGVPPRLGIPIQLTASPEAESIFRAMSE